MRVSTDSNSPYYDPKAFGYNAYLDGVRLKHCVEVDTDNGMAVVLRTRVDGSVMYPFDYMTLHGNVTVKIK